MSDQGRADHGDYIARFTHGQLESIRKVADPPAPGSTEG